MFRALGLSLFCIGFGFLVGCGGQQSSPPHSPNLAVMNPGAKPAPQAAPAKPGDRENAPAGLDLPADRKIIFSGTLVVEVRDFDVARTALTALLRTHGAFFAKTDVTGDSGKKRAG
ncbi:MAG TPA: hypothetical protein VGJ05_21040, partial [Fimbriiglobus sp.]